MHPHTQGLLIINPGEDKAPATITNEPVSDSWVLSPSPAQENKVWPRNYLTLFGLRAS